MKIILCWPDSCASATATIATAHTANAYRVRDDADLSARAPAAVLQAIYSATRPAQQSQV